MLGLYYLEGCLLVTVNIHTILRWLEGGHKRLKKVVKKTPPPFSKAAMAVSRRALSSTPRARSVAAGNIARKKLWK